MIKVNNIPDYAEDYIWYVCNVVDEELWFWGAYNDHDVAFNAALDIGGVVVAADLVD